MGKSLILITFILFPILERAQTYELVNSTTTEEPKSHHLGFASVDLENEDESDSGCEGYGCENAPGYAPSYGAPSPVYGSPAPSYDEPTGSGAIDMLSSIMSTDFFSSGFPMAPDFDTTMELKFQEFLSELNEPCKLPESRVQNWHNISQITLLKMTLSCTICPLLKRSLVLGILLIVSQV